MTGKISRFSRFLRRLFIRRLFLNCASHRYGLALFSAFFLLLAVYRAPVAAILTGGVLKISALSVIYGGGGAAGGVVALKNANIGGAAASGTRLTAGNMSITAGWSPVAVIPPITAKTDLSAAHCYPVPFKPSLGHTKITFTNLTYSARIRIYTLSGELVRVLDKNDSGKTLDWDVRNARDSAVDSGVYLWLIENAVQKKKGKLMIIR